MRTKTEEQKAVPVFRPLLEHEETEAVAETLRVGWLGMGANVGAFEASFKEYIEAGDRHVAAVSTGHAALHLGLLLAGVGPGDEVITPSFNNIADFQAILATGANPVFCDIDEDTLCIDLNKAEELISDKTKAMIVMDYDCVLCDHDHVEEIRQRTGIRVVHDAAHSLGSRYKGKMIGSFSDICMFSFDPVKTLTTIDGGALVVKSEEELQQIHEMRLIGMGQPAAVMYQNQRAWTYDVRRVGFRYHMSNVHAALGLAQLRKMDRISTTRRETCIYYNSSLADLPEVQVPKTDFREITPFLYYIRVPAEMRDDLRAHLTGHGVDTGIHWQPGHTFTLLKNSRRGDLSVTEQVGREVLSLPLHSSMLKEDSQRVAEAVRSFFVR